MRNLVILFSVLFSGALFFSACQSSSDYETSETEQREMGQDQQQAPPQNQQMPQQNQSDIALSDEDLMVMSDLNMELQEVQNDASNQLISMIEDKGMTTEEYQQLSQMMETGAGDQITEAQVNTMEEINAEMMTIRTSMQQEMDQVLEENGYTMEEFQEMSMVISQNPEYQQRLMELQAN